MRDLGQIQYSELANDVRRGWVDIADVIVVQFVGMCQGWRQAKRPNPLRFSTWC